VCGLFQSQKRNMERMVEQVADSEYYSIQHFISESPWDARAGFESVTNDTDKIFEDQPVVCFLIDESAHTKKGDKSVGVSRQYSGQLGKVDNCQVAVYGALSAGEYYSLIDAHLYLPKEWADDKKRCLVADIPAQDICFRTKPELAGEMLAYHKKRGTRFHWAVADGLYGHDSKLREETDALGILYMFDVHSDDRVYLEPPHIYLPEKTSSKGRKPIHLKTDTPSYKVIDLGKELEEGDWKEYHIRNTTKGVLHAHVWVKKIYTWNGTSQNYREETLVIRRTKDDCGRYEYKCSLSNASDQKYSWLELAQVQAQRYFVERSFQEAKQQAGMSEYQVRGWLAWHHHIALVMMSMFFVLSEKMLYSDQYPLLSTYDVRQFMIHTYACKINSAEDVLDQMNFRHKQRKMAIDQYYKLQI
jgi:SRSO17 transposase